MANQLDEVNGTKLSNGRDINVIAKNIPVEVGLGSAIFELSLWLCLVPGILVLLGKSLPYYYGLGLIIVGLIVVISYKIKKVHASNYLLRLEQKIQHDASQIDNYLEQRVQILQNTVGLVEKATNIDKTVFKDLALARSGSKISSDSERNDTASTLAKADKNIQVAFENYPDLQSHEAIQKAMQENSYLQKEITAAREVYNDSVYRWNTEIFVWPCNMIVAAHKGYTTRIPFIADAETKTKARSKFF